MPYIRPGVRRLFDLMLRRRDRSRRDVADEVALHLEFRQQQLMRQGLSRSDARHEAARRFGSADGLHALERSAYRRDRRMSFRDWLDSVRQDVRYALRGLRREPAFTGFAVLTLALGIGANAAMFGVVDRLLLRGPDHVIDADRLVRFTATVTRPSGVVETSAQVGYVVYDNLRRHGTASLTGFAAYQSGGQYTMGRGRNAHTVPGAAATADFFSLLGVSPARGRFFLPDEDDVADPARVVVLGDALWRTQFARDPDIIGKTIHVRDEPFTVIGIAPRGFTGVELSRVDLWVPMSYYSRNIVSNWSRSWNAQWLHVLGRLKPGMGRATAAEEATRIHRLAYDGPPTRAIAKATFGVTPTRFTPDGTESSEVLVARWLVGVTAIVLLIACSNVANLLLARSIRRQGEVGVRIALGAGRRRLARLFVTESLVIATLGGAAALAVAAWISTLARTALLTNIEWTSSVVSGRVLVVALSVTLIVGLVVGLAPALHAARSSVHAAMQRGRAQERRWRAGAWPTVIQATLTACLLIGAGLFVRSLHRARTLPLGFESDRILVAEPHWSAALTGENWGTARGRRNDAMRRALARLQQHPSVEYAAIAVGSPFGNGFGVDLFVPGFDSIPQLPGGGPYISAVTADYFATVGTRVLRGRTFTNTEGPGTPPVTIVNETMAKTLWPGQDALTTCIRIGADTMPCASIVGVVEDAHRWSLKEQPAMQYYIPFGQEVGFGGSVFMIRPRGEPRAFADAAIHAVEDTDAAFERATAWPLREKIDPLLRPWKLGATIFTMGGALALLVAALGLYSVMSYSVAQRTHEMGVRIALGARSRSIVVMVLRQGILTAAIGVSAGIVIALLAGNRLGGLLFETSPRDVTIIGGATIVLLGSAVAATLWPALRAGRVDPIRALKAD